MLEEVLRNVLDSATGGDARKKNGEGDERILRAAKFFMWYRYTTSFHLSPRRNAGERETNLSFTNYLQRDPDSLSRSWPESRAYLHMLDQQPIKDKPTQRSIPERREEEEEILRISRELYLGLVEQLPIAIQKWSKPWNY